MIAALLMKNTLKTKAMDNKELAWHLINAFANHISVLSIESAVLDEAVERLYPEFDGDKVTMQEWGWKTPEGDIRYEK
jgi:hypothetical protein